MQVLRYVAFSTDPVGGNPAGVVLDAGGATDEQMQAIAAELGYSETAFLQPEINGDFTVRYFSPLAEVPFCGHATIATAVAYAERHGPGELRLSTASGLVRVSTAAQAAGLVASLVSVPPRVELLGDVVIEDLLEALRWSAADLDPALPVRCAYAGAWHPIVAAATRDRLAALDYDYPALAALMTRQQWTTIDLVWRESTSVFHARNPFPPGGIVEDPATGAAAAAMGAYLRELGLIEPPATLTVHQGVDIGRPSLLTVHVPEGDGGIVVSGAAVQLS